MKRFYFLIQVLVAAYSSTAVGESDFPWKKKGGGTRLCLSTGCNGKVTLKDDGKYVSAKYNLYNASSSTVRVEMEYFWLSDGRWKRTTGKHKVHSGSPLNIFTKARRERPIACILKCKR